MTNLKSLAVLGAGAMATALIKGWLGAGLIRPDQVVAADILPERRTAMERLGVKAVIDVSEAVAGAEVVLVAVKPQHVLDVLSDIRETVLPDSLVVTIAAGIPLATFESVLKPGTAVVRVMPNTPCLVGASATGLSPGEHAGASQVDLVLNLFSTVGIAYVLPEKMLDAVTGLSGSGPAYVYMVIEALADGGVAAGLPRDIAASLAAQTVLGAARMVLETGSHPAVLRDLVTSPAGTTAAGLLTLENRAVRSAFAQAVIAAKERSSELGRATNGKV